MNVKNERVVNFKGPLRYFAYIKGAKVTKEVKGYNMLELQLQVPIHDVLEGCLRTSIPVDPKGIEKVYECTAIMDDCKISESNVKDLIGEYCLIEIVIQNKGGNRTVEFLPFTSRSKYIDVENLNYVPEDVVFIG